MTTEAAFGAHFYQNLVCSVDAIKLWINNFKYWNDVKYINEDDKLKQKST